MFQVTLPSTSRKHARAHGTEALGFPPPPPTPSPLKAPVVSHSTAHPPTAKRFRRSQSPFCPHSPPPEHTLPPATAAPPFPSVKRARTKRPVAAVQDAVLALPCPLPAPASTQPLPPQVPQPPVFPGRGQPLTSLGVPASPRLLAPASLSPSALLADDTVRKYEVFCKPKTGMEGANLEGTLCVMRSKRAIVICTCRDCLETHGEREQGK